MTPLRQPHPWACGPTALQMIADHHGLPTAGRIMALSTWALMQRQGVSLAALSVVASGIGFNSRCVRAESKALEKLRYPAIAHVRIGEDQHWLVLHRVTASRVLVYDPGDGEAHMLLRSQFEQIWDGVLLLLAPLGQDWFALTDTTAPTGMETGAGRKKVSGHLNPAREWITCGQPCRDIHDRVFMCMMPACISYSDRCTEEHSDYKKLANLFYATCELEIQPDCPPELRAFIEKDAAQYKPGDTLRVATCGQSVTLGYALAGGAL